MKQIGLLCSLLFAGLLLLGAGCGGDPNVEGAKLALTLDEIDYDDYYSKLDESIAADPTNAEAYEVKGRLYMRQLGEVRDVDQRAGLVQSMVQTFNMALETQPEYPEVDNFLTQAYIDEFKLGIQAFNRGREDENAYAEAVQYFQNTTAIRPDSVDPYLNQAYAMLQTGSQADAIVPFEKAIALGDSDVETMTYLANLYQMEDRGTDAVTLLEKATGMYPENEEVRSQLLNSYITTGQMDVAMSKYSDAVNSEPDNKLYRYNFGTLLLEAEKYEDAIEQFAAATELDPEYGVAFYNLGVAYVNQAVAVNDDITQMDDDLRANRSDLSTAQIEEAEKNLDMKIEERKGLFQSSISPLESARTLMEANGEDLSGICQALFQAYAQVGEQDKAEEAATCAGIDLN